MMFIAEYSLPIAAALLLIIFLFALPDLSRCRLPQFGLEMQRDGRRASLPILLITAVYAVVSALVSIPLLGEAAALVPAELSGIIIGTGVISTLIMTFITWVFVSALFFACLKFIGYAVCSFKDILSVCSYVSVILIISSVLTLLVWFIGAAPAVLLLALQGVFLLWSIPVWYFGFAAVCDIPAKKLKMSIAVPVILMVVVSLFSLIGA